MTKHPTDNQIEAAIKTLEGVINAANNSNHAGEVALMRAFSVVSGSHVAMPKEPTHEIMTALYGPYLSADAQESRIEGYSRALMAQAETVVRMIRHPHLSQLIASCALFLFALQQAVTQTLNWVM